MTSRFPPRIIGVLLLTVGLCASVLQTSAPAQEPAEKPALAPDDPSVRLLHDHGVEPNTASLRNYLKSMLPDSNSRKQQAKLIQDLGHADYHVRERSMKKFLRLPSVHVDLLKRAAKGPDPEVRWRAGRLLKTASQRSSDILHASYSVIADGAIKGLAADVLATMPLCTENFLLNSAARALKVTATKKDAALLKKHLDDTSQPIRLAAVDAYAEALGAEADPLLLKLTEDDDETVKVHAAIGMIRHGNRDALPILGRLLESKTLEVRVSAVKTLRAVSGKRFKFIAYDEEKNRARARDDWNNWIASHAATVDLKLPLKEGSYEIGRLIICDYMRHRVIELDLNHKQIWEHPAGRHPWAVQGLPNGHRLVASYSDRAVKEYDAKGRLVWAKTELPPGSTGGPTSVERLENGNTLVACTDSHKVIEINPRGDTVWTVSITQRPTDAHRLENGRTLICLQNGGRVVEVDRKGAVKWQITGLSRPFSAYRLENGNTLVACSGNGAVIEYDRRGKEVWAKRGFTNVYDAQRLANGNTLIGDNRGIREVDRNGKIVWEKAMTGVSKFHRY